MFQLELLKSDFFKPETFIFFSFLQQQHCFVHLSETKQTDCSPFSWLLLCSNCWTDWDYWVKRNWRQGEKQLNKTNKSKNTWQSISFWCQNSTSSPLARDGPGHSWSGLPTAALALDGMDPWDGCTMLTGCWNGHLKNEQNLMKTVSAFFTAHMRLVTLHNCKQHSVVLFCSLRSLISIIDFSPAQSTQHNIKTTSSAVPTRDKDLLVMSINKWVPRQRMMLVGEPRHIIWALQRKS